MTPGLWSSIQAALDNSEHFVLLASPEAARSPWVNREIEHWIATKSASRILPVVTDGEWAWDAGRGDFAEGSTAVPPALHGVFTEEPFFLDLRWARGSEHLSLQHSRFRDAIAQLAAPMHGVSTDELEGEDIRQHRRARRLRSGAVVTLVVFALLASLTGWSAVRNSERAKASLAEALRQQQVANEQRSLAELATEEAHRQGELAKQQQERATLAAAEAKKSEKLARAQQILADEAGADAKRQQRLADQATTRTREQEQLARQAAARAEREQKEAERLARIAAEQRRLADVAAAAAQKQQRVAVSRRLMNQATAEIKESPKTALMLGAAAEQLNPDSMTRRQLTGVITATNYAGSISDVTSAKYLPDGVLVTLGIDGWVSLWNVSDPTRPARIATLTDAGTTSRVPQISPDGRTLAIVNGSGKAVLWDIANRSRPVRLATVPTAGPVTAMTFSKDGSTFATGEATEATTMWDTSDRKRPVLLWTMGFVEPDPDYETDPVDQLMISSTGRYLLVSQTYLTQAYDLIDRTHPVPVRLESVGSFSGPKAFSPDGLSLAVGGGDRVFCSVAIYELSGPPNWAIRLNGLSGVPNSVAFSTDGKLVAAGDKYGKAMIWDVTSSAGPQYFTSVKTRSPIAGVSFDPDAQTLLTVETSGTATLWNIPPPGAPDPLATVTVSSGSNKATAFSPDGRSLLAAASGGTAGRWNTTNPRTPVRGADLDLHSGAVRAVAFSPDLRTVAAVASATGALTVADTTRPAVKTTLTTLPTSPGETMLFSPDGRTLAVLSNPTTVTLWDVADRARPARLGQLSSAVHSPGMAFSPDGRTLAVGVKDAQIALLDIADRSAPALLGTMSGHSDLVNSLTFSPDGRYLASGSDDESAILWNVTDRARPHRLATLDGNGWAVQAVAFSPDGRTLAVGVGYSPVILWDTADPAFPVRLARIRGVHDGDDLDDLVFRRDGRTLAVTGKYESTPGTVMLWDYQRLNSLRAEPAKYACAITRGGLTAAEWARYIPEIRYQRTCRN